MDYKDILEKQIILLEGVQEGLNTRGEPQEVLIIEISRQIQSLTETLINKYFH
ncbi:hypothetical protein REC12_20375 [Desulfosporosinus sp. PR]|uniref:hypothetical protein n=1 Tax=Candidatus Desulfosporosinus nitrosoreducens TaxID=3401928 RepID=UPI0027EF7DFB|nr:hypothetical protein [Desulfosporosinus sp. PR]MDQ7095954.1 hypothetical protein [Desulfosporosinus sp. PR]